MKVCVVFLLLVLFAAVYGRPKKAHLKTKGKLKNCKHEKARKKSCCMMQPQETQTCCQEQYPQQYPQQYPEQYLQGFQSNCDQQQVADTSMQQPNCCESQGTTLVYHYGGDGGAGGPGNGVAGAPGNGEAGAPGNGTAGAPVNEKAGAPGNGETGEPTPPPTNNPAATTVPLTTIPKKKKKKEKKTTTTPKTTTTDLRPVLGNPQPKEEPSMNEPLVEVTTPIPTTFPPTTTTTPTKTTTEIAPPGETTANPNEASPGPTTPKPNEEAPPGPTTPKPIEEAPPGPTTPKPNGSPPGPTTPKPNEKAPPGPTNPKPDEEAPPPGPTTPKPDEEAPPGPTTPNPNEEAPPEDTTPKPPTKKPTKKPKVTKPKPPTKKTPTPVPEEVPDVTTKAPTTPTTPTAEEEATDAPTTNPPTTTEEATTPEEESPEPTDAPTTIPPTTTEETTTPEPTTTPTTTTPTTPTTTTPTLNPTTEKPLPEIEDDVLFEGDMLVPKTDADLFLEKGGIEPDPAEGRRKKSEKKWIRNTIPIMIDSSLMSNGQEGKRFIFGKPKPEPFKKRLIAATKKWSQKTCINFKKKTVEDSYVIFKKGETCAATVGKTTGGHSLVTVNDMCLDQLVHMVGHVIGLFHEQSRPDRDRYIEIKWENIPKQFQPNFGKYYRFLKLKQITPYDYNSVMHFRKDEYAMPSTESFSLKGLLNKAKSWFKGGVGQRDAPTENDLQRVRTMYKCTGY